MCINGNIILPRDNILPVNKNFLYACTFRFYLLYLVHFLRD